MGELVVLYFKVKLFLLKEQIKTVVNYYFNLRFALFDLCIGLSSLFINPYRLCRKFLEKKGAVYIDGYGETPYSTFKQIASAAQLTSKDHYVELGSGRGKTCVWAAQIIGCQVSGIEWVPSLARLSGSIGRLLGVPVQFELQSMFTADLSQATVAYLYSTQLTEDEIKKISFSSMPSGSRIITISQPHPDFNVLKIIPVTFPWGDTFAYIHSK